MESITIIAKEGNLLPSFKEIIYQLLPQSIIQNQPNSSDFVVQSIGSDRVYFRYEGNSLETIIGWSEEEKGYINNYFTGNYHVYSADYRNISTMKTIICGIADTEYVLIDNDFGTLAPGDKFVQKIHQNPKWSWFTDLQV